MKKLFIFLLLVMMIGSFSSYLAYAGTDKYNDGSWKITSDGALTPVTTSASLKDYPEVVATGDTLTASQSGRTLLVTPTDSGGKVTLPSATAANVGLKYHIIDGKETPGYAYTFSVDPYSTNQIIYSISGTVLDAGDKLTSTGATGDSITLVCGAAGKWYIENMKGSWTDGGE